MRDLYLADLAAVSHLTGRELRNARRHIRKAWCQRNRNSTKYSSGEFQDEV